MHNWIWYILDFSRGGGSNFKYRLKLEYYSSKNIRDDFHNFVFFSQLKIIEDISVRADIASFYNFHLFRGILPFFLIFIFREG